MISSHTRHISSAQQPELGQKVQDTQINLNFRDKVLSNTLSLKNRFVVSAKFKFNQASYFIWLVATIPESTDVEHSHHCRNVYGQHLFRTPESDMELLNTVSSVLSNGIWLVCRAQNKQNNQSTELTTVIKFLAFEADNTNYSNSFSSRNLNLISSFRLLFICLFSLLFPLHHLIPPCK